MQKQSFTDQATGDTIHYWTAGNPKSYPMVLIHGFTGSHQGFEYIAPLLKEYYMIMPDLPGFGVSPLPEGLVSLGDIAQRINSFVAQLKFSKKPYLISHSMGTLVASHMLDQQAALYNKKTVFISPVPTRIGLLDGRRPGAILGQLQYTIGDNIPGIGPALVRNKTLSRVLTLLMLTTHDRERRKRIYQHHLDNLDHISSLSFYRHIYRDTNRQGIIDNAEKIKKLDTLIIAGNRDSITPHPLQILIAKDLNAKLHTIPGVGHLSHYERPEAVAEAIDTFLS